jgi:hypothetical protein
VSAPTDDDIQALLVLQVGEVPGSLLASNVATAWALHAGEPDAVKRLTVRLDLIDIALGYYRGIVSFTDADHSQQASDMAKRLLDMRKSLARTPWCWRWRRARARKGRPAGSSPPSRPGRRRPWRARSRPGRMFPSTRASRAARTAAAA